MLSQSDNHAFQFSPFSFIENTNMKYAFLSFFRFVFVPLLKIVFETICKVVWHVSLIRIYIIRHSGICVKWLFLWSKDLLLEKFIIICDLWHFDMNMTSNCISHSSYMCVCVSLDMYKYMLVSHYECNEIRVGKCQNIRCHATASSM